MSVTAVRTIGITYSGDETTAGTGTTSSSTNSDAPGEGAYLVNLASGFNTITIPTGHTVYGVDIYPPSGNSTALTLKGITGDTGIPLHVTKATSIAFVTGATTFGLTTGSAMSVRLAYW
jgi:hypothetical protein